MTGNRYLLRLAAFTMTVIALTLLVADAGWIAYLSVAFAGILMVTVLATATRESLRTWLTRFRLELLISAVTVIGILATTFLPIPTNVNGVLVNLVAVLMAAVLVMMAVKTFRMLRLATRVK